MSTTTCFNGEIRNIFLAEKKKVFSGAMNMGQTDYRFCNKIV